VRPVCIGGLCDGEVFGGEEDGGDAVEGEELPRERGGVGGAAGEVLDCGGGGAGWGEEGGAREELEGVVVGGGFGLDKEGAPGVVVRWGKLA